MPKSKKLSKADLENLGNTVIETEITKRIVKVGITELEMYNQSPMLVYDFMNVMTRTITSSPEMKAIVIKFFPQIEEIYEGLSYISLMEILSHIATTILSDKEKEDLQEVLVEKDLIAAEPNKLVEVK